MRRSKPATRILLVSPSLKDRSFVRESRAETLDLFEGLSLSVGEKASFQEYGDEGWKTVHLKSS